MRIAVFMPNWVGDAVMATPALRALRRQYPQAHIIGVLKPYVAGVLEGTPWLDRMLYLDTKGPRRRRWHGVVPELRRHRPDLAVLFGNTFRAALVAWLAGCRQRLGYRRHLRDWFLNDALDVERDARGQIVPRPAIDAYNRLAERAGCQAPGYRLELFSTPRDEAAADEVWERAGFASGNVVCLNPGAAFGSAKHWPAESFVELARRLVDERGSQVLVLCGPHDRILARRIAQAVQRSSVYSLCDHPLSLGLTKACVRRAALLITTDSGPRHFASAFGRPVVTLFGPTHIAWTETYQPLAVHLQKSVPCGPCQRRVCPLDHRCMTTLLPEEVFAAACRLLDQVQPLAA